MCDLDEICLGRSSGKCLEYLAEKLQIQIGEYYDKKHRMYRQVVQTLEASITAGARQEIIKDLESLKARLRKKEEAANQIDLADIALTILMVFPLTTLPAVATSLLKTVFKKLFVSRALRESVKTKTKTKFGTWLSKADEKLQLHLIDLDLHDLYAETVEELRDTKVKMGEEAEKGLNNLLKSVATGETQALAHSGSPVAAPISNATQQNNLALSLVDDLINLIKSKADFSDILKTTELDSVNELATFDYTAAEQEEVSCYFHTETERLRIFNSNSTFTKLRFLTVVTEVLYLILPIDFLLENNLATSSLENYADYNDVRNNPHRYENYVQSKDETAIDGATHPGYLELNKNDIQLKRGEELPIFNDNLIAQHLLSRITTLLADPELAEFSDLSLFEYLKVAFAELDRQFRV